MKKFWNVLCVILFLLATGGMIAAIVCQTVLVYKAYGDIDLQTYHVKHWTSSLWASVALYIPCIIIGFWGGFNDE